MDAVLITAVEAIGTEEGDERAYIVCELNGQSTHALAFDAQVSHRLSAAVLTASAHLTRKSALRDGISMTELVGSPIPIDTAFVSVATPKDGTAPKLVLTLETREGAQLHFDLRGTVGPSLADALGGVTRRSPKRPN